MTCSAQEVNFDGIVGPTHNYAGLAKGNLASTQHAHWESNPREAALQGLSKMRLLADLGVRQAVLPPQDRPDVGLLRRVGFCGDDAAVVEQAGRDAPDLLAAACSASSMWAANAATVSPSADTVDGRVHFTPANLTTCLHRSLEPRHTGAALRTIFNDTDAFCVHDALPHSPLFSDEGAANHTRLCPSHSEPGIEMFTYGRLGSDDRQSAQTRYVARQTLEASQAVARLHQIDSKRVLIAKQNPAAIDAGVFHNDVIAVGNENVLLYHEEAFEESDRVVDELRDQFGSICDEELYCLRIAKDELSLMDAVKTYLFNSQLVTRRDGGICLVCPAESEAHPDVKAVVKRLIAEDNPITQVRFVDLRQSMMNGGGPACLRLRVVLTEPQLNRIHQGVLWTPSLDRQLGGWVSRHYRTCLSQNDLNDPALLLESRAALDELTHILDLPGLYDFQRG